MKLMKYVFVIKITVTTYNLLHILNIHVTLLCSVYLTIVLMILLVLLLLLVECVKEIVTQIMTVLKV
jgi:hypothetical protein